LIFNLGRDRDDCVPVLSRKEEVKGQVSSVFKLKSQAFPNTLTVIVALSFLGLAGDGGGVGSKKSKF
jgi:hypothetical protein